MVDPTSALGLIAGTCTTFALAPQAYKVWKSGRVDQLSLGMLSLMSFGTALWLIYGVLRSDISIIWANVIAIQFLSYMLTVKIKDVRATRQRS
jgi:MtN3 and saliva related transmembrane protein